MTFRLLSALGLLACLSPLPAQAFVLTGVVTLHSLDGFWNDNAAALETLFGPIPSYELRFEIDPEDLVYESFFNTTLTDGGAFRLHQSADLRLEATGFALSGTSLSSRTQDQRSTSGSTGDLVALDPGLIESLDAPLPAFDLYLASLGQTRTMTAFSDFDLALNFQPMGAVGDVFEGADLEARQWMLAAASMGATAFQKGLGAIHSVSHPVGARYDTHHGLTNAVVFPYVMLRNRPAIEDKMDAVSRMLDLKGRGFTAVLDWVLELREALDIPKTLAELGVKEEDAAAIAADALNDPTAGANPIRFSAQEFEALTLAAIRGDLSPV